MIGLPGVRFSDVEKQYKKVLDENKKIAMTSENNTTGGFLDKTNERRYQVAVKAWRDYIVNNKKNSANVKYLNELTIKTKGDISKGPRAFTNIMREDYHDIIKLFADLKRNKEIKNKKMVENISNYSFLSIFQESVDFLTDPKYISAFNKAYIEFEKNKGKPLEADITNIFVMSHQIITFYVCLCCSVLNREIDLSPTINGTYDENQYGLDIEKIQMDYKSLFATIGYTVIELLGFLKSVKNPAQEVEKAIKNQRDAIKKMQAAESAEITEKMAVYRELSQENYLVDRSFEPNRGQEEVLTIALIVVGSIAGLIALIALIKRCIYLIGTITIDIMSYIMVDEATIRMNVEILKDKLEKTTDAKEKKRLQKIIEKQEKWADKFKNMTDNLKKNVQDSAYKADALESDDEKYIETTTGTNVSTSDSGQNTSTTDNGDFTIIM